MFLLSQYPGILCARWMRNRKFTKPISRNSMREVDEKQLSQYPGILSTVREVDAKQEILIEFWSSNGNENSDSGASSHHSFPAIAPHPPKIFQTDAGIKQKPEERAWG